MARLHLFTGAQVEVQLTSLSAVNPTKVLLGSGSGAVLLEAGQSRLLAPGDRVLLLACDPSMHVELISCDTGGGSGDAAAAAAGAGGPEQRPSKRARSGCEQQAQQDGQPEQQQQQQGCQQQQDGEPEQQQQQQRQQQQRQQDGQQQRNGQQQQEEQAPSAGVVAAAGASVPPVMLVLVGVQGAGKSTFCNALIRRKQQQQGHQQAGQAQPRGSQQQEQQQQQQQQQQEPRWVRINQDSIAGPGRRGSREQCLEAARAALQRGDSCLIDRTNVGQDQRRPFVRLAQQQGAQAHCLVLKLPRKLCMDRAAARTDHEGGLQGKAVYPAVSRMYSDLVESGDPHPREGFTSVLICESDGEVEAALEAWSLFGPAHPDPATEYARLKPPPPKKPALNTLDRFLARKPGEVGGGQDKAAGAGTVRRHSPTAGAAAELQQGLGGQQQLAQQQEQPPQQPSAAGQANSGRPGSAGGGPTNAFQAMLAAARQQGRHSASSPGGGAAAGTDGSGDDSGQQPRHTFRAAGPFANSLVKIAESPESCRSEQPHLWYDDRCVLIEDKFPKGREHWLVLARDRRLEGPLSLTAGDVPLLEHMLGVARQKVAELRCDEPALRFRLGFHAVPSLRQLHMHVISQDFDSACLKHKKHWNSFTHPSFFLDAAWALSELCQAGRLRYSLAAAKAAEKADLRCHRCGASLANMPALKTHIASCSAPLPAATE
ncbi:hypothetical protein ABPG77_002199 [Micractinium sp. CCAP 211/92]